VGSTLSSAGGEMIGRNLFGGRSRRRRERSSDAQQWTPEELAAMLYLEDYLRNKRPEPVFEGVADVIFARDRAAVVRALDEHPELLSDRGDYAFQAAELMISQISPGRVTALVERAHAGVVPIRETPS
jgi:hypothetical protein